ncbi:hypothetical protein AMECASPLE_024333, partial [Ameca splendens]
MASRLSFGLGPAGSREEQPSHQALSDESRPQAWLQGETSAPPYREVWACWCELLSYLEQENAFLDQLEQKLDETENLQGGAEELQEALDSLDVLLQHPEDNRNQIRELAQMLMDGGVLDELIQQKLYAFNTRWDELMAR